DREIGESIVENNLHGIDIDPWAVQIAAAALFLKLRQACPEAHPRRLNLVASNLRLASLADDDPALVELRREIEAETGIPATLTDTLVQALQGADHLGSLLRIDEAVEAAVAEHEASAQLGLFEAPAAGSTRGLEPEKARRTLLDRLEGFLARHGSGDDLGLRLRGEQIAAGVRFMRIVEEGRYDLVMGNPPYQGTSKMKEDRYVKKHYRKGKADLYAAFLERGLQLVRPGGVSALLTMRNWMFIKQYAELRQWLLESWELRAVGDFAIGAFDEVPNDLLSVTVSVFRRSSPEDTWSVAQQPTPPEDQAYDRRRTKRKRAATLCHVGCHPFNPTALRAVPGWPLVYWWPSRFLQDYEGETLLGEAAPVRIGMKTSNNRRYVRFPFEVQLSSSSLVQFTSPVAPVGPWVPYVQGAAGRSWIDPVWELVWWKAKGL
ncbi:MAG: SAM-dependent methyltransferase, partial [bacterium]|nr:SAM-dependent methyltransferase [bacterium]